MNGLIGIKFILEDGAFLQVPVTREEGDRVIREWNSGALQNHTRIGTGVGWIGPPPTGGVLWGVDVGKIAAVHTFDLQSISVPQQPVAGSGLVRQSPPYNFLKG